MSVGFKSNDGNLIDVDLVRVPFESLDVQNVEYLEVVYSSLLRIELNFALDRSEFYTHQRTPHHVRCNIDETSWNTLRLVQTCLKHDSSLKNT